MAIEKVDFVTPVRVVPGFDSYVEPVGVTDDNRNREVVAPEENEKGSFRGHVVALVRHDDVIERIAQYSTLVAVSWGRRLLHRSAEKESSLSPQRDVPGLPSKKLFLRGAVQKKPLPKNSLAKVVELAGEFSKLKNGLEKVFGKIAKSSPNEFLAFGENVGLLSRWVAENPDDWHNVLLFFSALLEKYLPYDRAGASAVCEQLRYLLPNTNARTVLGSINSAYMETHRRYLSR